jgi:hypothetical protein
VKKEEGAMRKSALFILAIIGLFSAALAQVKQEVEPNDKWEQAQEVRVGDIVEGGIQQNNDDDWFKLTVDKTGKNYLQLDLSAVPEVDTCLYIYDANHQELASINDAPKGRAETIAHFPVTPGVYYVRAWLGGKAGGDKYMLSMKITGPWKEGWESEPNDGRNKANDLKWGQAVQGFFDHKNDEDFYKLVVDGPGRSLVQIDLSGVPGVDGEIYLYNENGSTIWSVKENDKGEPESIFNLALAPGVYYVDPWAREINRNDPYTLTPKILGPWREGTEAEPNNRKDDATDLRLGQSVEGYFLNNGDEDYYRLIVDKPGKNEIRVDLSAVPGVDTRLELCDMKENVLWEAKDGSKGEPKSILSFFVTEGTYLIWVKGYAKNITDKYTLTTRLLGPWKEGQEAEPNNDIKQANEIKLNVPFSGHIHAVYDSDYYAVKVPEPGLDIMVVRLSGVPGICWNLYRHDIDDNELDQSRTGEAGTGEEMVMMKVLPGTYYLEVQVRSGKNVGAEYTLYAGRTEKTPATAEEVQKALIKALDWLASKQQKDGSWYGHEPAFTGLSLMSFIGAKCVPKDYSVHTKAAVQYLKSVHKPGSEYADGSKDADYYGGQLGSDNMYEHAIATLSLIEALVDLNDPSLEPLAQEAISLIIRSQNTEHKPETLGGPIKPDDDAYGGWRYNPTSTGSDLSVSGWQILTLRGAMNAGFSVPDHVFPSAAKFVRSLRGKKDGSFGYTSGGDWGNSCARAGMGSLSLQLCGLPQDPAIPPALRFMQDHAPRWNVEYPGDNYPFYYWYYGTRAMYLAGGDDWRIWNDWMCRFLVDHQSSDGSWDGAGNETSLETYRVALGALMLEFCCGQVPIYMSPAKRSGPGTLKVDLEKGAEKEAAKTVEIIMDASNSMTGMVGKETKIAAARRVLIQTINGLPDTMSVGFRVYGHRYATDDYDNACRDTELLVPIGPVQKALLVDMVNKIQTKGRTPLVTSVLAAVKDLEKFPNGTVILVTDGIESCKGDIKSIAPAIKAAGLALEVDIVGFDIKEAAARQELQSIAASTGGRYLDAKDADELLSALQKTLKLEYVVVDAAGKEAGRGVVGDEGLKLKEGDYTVRVVLAPQPLERRVTVKAGTRATCTLKKTQGKWIIE